MAEEKTNLEKEITIPEIIQVSDFAQKLGLSVTEVIAGLLKNGVSATINEQIDFETAAIVAMDFGVTLKKEKAVKEDNKEFNVRNILEKENKKDLQKRPPVVAVMGHVDHGKTSLLDAIRETNVVGKESGGITQHIGAYQIDVKVKNEAKKITFLDTPGHKAFVEMRARGALVTDIVILVVDATDKVQPQTIESINHAKDSSLPVILAINKVDLPAANPRKVKEELMEHGFVTEDMGGDIVAVEVSAKQKKGLSDLLEMILLIADMSDLKANPRDDAIGTVIESHVDLGKGPVATVLVQNGTLKLLDNIVIGEHYGKVRTMETFLGEKVKKALPSMPVQISGFSGVPEVGDILKEMNNEQEAKESALKASKEKAIKKIKQTVVTPNSTESKKELNIILKADVGGSLEAIKSEVMALGNDEVGTKVIKEGVGEVVESDVFLAASTKSEILGFHVRVTPAAKKAAKKEGVKITLFKIIYELTSYIKDNLENLLEPEIIQKNLGKMKVLKIFKTSKEDFILGAKVTDGIAEKGVRAVILKKGQFVGKGILTNLKKGEKDAKEIKAGEECGINFKVTEGTFEFEEGDTLELVKEEKKRRTL